MHPLFFQVPRHWFHLPDPSPIPRPPTLGIKSPLPPGITSTSVVLRTMCLHNGIDRWTCAVPALVRSPVPPQASPVANIAGGYRPGITAGVWSLEHGGQFLSPDANPPQS